MLAVSKARMESRTVLFFFISIIICKSGRSSHQVTDRPAYQLPCGRPFIHMGWFPVKPQRLFGSIFNLVEKIPEDGIPADMIGSPDEVP